MIMQELTQTDIVERLDLLTEVSVALGDGHDDIDIFLDRILKVAKSMTNADGGTRSSTVETSEGPVADLISFEGRIAEESTLGPTGAAIERPMTVARKKVVMCVSMREF